MAASTTIYNLARLAHLSAGVNFVSDTIKVSLHTSSYTPSATTHQYFSDVTATQVSTTNTGYTAGGATLAGKSASPNVNNYTARANATQWTAGSSNLTARYAIVYKDTGTASTSPLICYVLLDTTPSDVTATSGGTFTINWDPTNGIYYL